MLTSGMFLVDRYEILAKIGTGGMADVYKAKDHILGRVVAVKVLKAEFSEDVNFVTKFRTEAQSAAGLEHPNIVNIYDVGSENGLHFIVMEHIEGITLKTYIEKKGQLTFKESTSIAIQVARGIETAHNKEITHRDIKPQNIIISTEGKVKVTDFGIARASNSNTISADVMGSVHYASPEQARNGYVDGRSDIYSLGIVMYEMVTGRVPFDGDTTVAVALQHLQEEMVGPSKYAPNLPISYEKIVLKCTQKNPDRRYQNIGELLTDLRKSLITPDEDFVVIAPLATASKTRTIGAEELDLINSMAEETDLEQETHFAGGPELPVHHKKPVKGASVEDYDDDYDDDDEDEDDEDTGFMNPKVEKVLTWLGIIVLVLIIALSIYFVRKIVDIFDGGRNTQTESTQTETESETESETETDTESETEGIPENMVEMIDIVGMHVDEAKDRLQALGLNIWIGASKKSDLPDGTVLEQDVAEGDLVEKGDTIVVITAGENTSASKHKVPLVVGLPEEDAAQTLKDAKFKVQREYINDDEVREGYVISQTPEYGEDAEEMSYVTIYISLGPEAVQMPELEDMVGLDYETVAQMLDELGFTVKTENSYSDEYAEGLVCDVSNAGEEVAYGSEITIYVSIGEEPDYKYYVTYDFGAHKPAGAESYKFTLQFESDSIVTKYGSGSSFDTMNYASSSEISNVKITINWMKADGEVIETVTGKSLTVQKEVLEEGEEVPANIFYTPSSVSGSTESTETEDTEVGGDSSTEDTATEDTSAESSSADTDNTEDTQN